VELSKAGDFCRSNLVFVLDENGNNIFGCRPYAQRANKAQTSTHAVCAHD